MNNIFVKSLVSVGKIIVAIALIYCTYLLLLQKDLGGIYFGIGFLILITLPTIFAVYFKNKFIKRHLKFAKAWKFLRIIYVLILILFVAIMAFGLYRLYQKNKTEKAIDFINSTKITLDDVMGKNLPLEPDQKLNDSTISGIDANKNNIRDDVELAIFKEYPNSAKIRAAELQYAQALQLELTQVFNSKTLIPVMQKEDLSFDCLGFSGPDTSLATANKKQKEVESLVFNTNLRTQKQSDIYKKYMTGYASLPGNECDIELSSLPN